MKLHQLASLLIGILFLPGCGPTMIIDEENTSAVAVNGAVLNLHQEVTIAPGRARVFFQHGRVVGGINEFAPHCELTVRSLQEIPQTIHADIFTVIGVTGDVQKVVRSGKIMVASLDGVRLADGGGGDDGESLEMQVLNMELKSELQPDVRYFVCGGAFDIPALARQPTLQGIRTAIGSIGTFEVH